MANWITTHYPHPKKGTHPWYIYLQDKFVKPGKIGTKIKDGDGVFFYELARNPLKNEQPAWKGLQGIVVAATVDGVLRKRSAKLAEDEKKNGTGVNYMWEIHTRKEDHTGFVAKEDVLRVLGFEPEYRFMGFGGGSGVKELIEKQYQELLDLFHKGRALRPALEKARGAVI